MSYEWMGLNQNLIKTPYEIPKTDVNTLQT